MVEIPTADPGATQICLIRHGETAWNAESRLQGQLDIALNETGVQQARAAGRWLKRAGITALYASDLQRARRTAELIGESLALSPRLTPALRERCYGIFEGLTHVEAQSRHPEIYVAFERRDPACDFETGETLYALFERVTRQLQVIAAQHPGEKVALVSHGGVLDIINRFVRGKSLDSPRDFLIPNAALNWIAAVEGDIVPGAVNSVWQIKTWAETAHLQAGVLDELPS
jgi:probable phosphoglycerate mutase